MAAPKGNLFALGNNGGAPPKFKTPKELAKKIADYLDYEDAQKRPDSYTGGGKGVYTLSGCCLFLGFSSKASMDDQAKRDKEFSNVISRFKLFMTHWNEQKMYWGGTYMAAQFWLRNHGGYTEESIQNNNNRNTEIKVEVVPCDVPLSNSEKDVKTD